MRSHHLLVPLLFIATPLLAGDGARLAQRIESQASPRLSARTLSRLAALNGRERRAFVAWASRRRRARDRPWKNLSKALARIKTRAAAAELGVVARTVDATDDRSVRATIHRALEGLTRIDAKLSVPIFLQGVRHRDRGVAGRHGRVLARFLAEGTSLAPDGPLRELIRFARKLEERDGEDDGEDARRELRRVRAAIQSFVASALATSSHPRAHLRLVDDADLPVAVLRGAARGIARRGVERLGPIRRAVRRLRSRAARAAERAGEEPPTISDAEARRRIFRAEPRLRVLWRSVRRERPRLEAALFRILEADQPAARIEVYKAAPAVRDGVSQDWADRLLPALDDRNPAVIKAAADALAKLAGTSAPGQSRQSWRAWWSGRELTK